LKRVLRCCKEGPTRGMEREYSLLVSFREMMPRSRSISFHVRPRISPLLAPVLIAMITIRNRISFLLWVQDRRSFSHSSFVRTRSRPRGSFSLETFSTGLEESQPHSLTPKERRLKRAAM